MTVNPIVKTIITTVNYTNRIAITVTQEVKIVIKRKFKVLASPVV